jgi:hypothetical protein
LKNAYYYLIQKLLSSYSLSNNIKTVTKVCLFLYGFGTWCLILKEERRLRVLENKILVKIFGSKTEEITSGC